MNKKLLEKRQLNVSVENILTPIETSSKKASTNFRGTQITQFSEKVGKNDLKFDVSAVINDQIKTFQKQKNKKLK